MKQVLLALALVFVTGEAWGNQHGFCISWDRFQGTTGYEKAILRTLSLEERLRARNLLLDGEGIVDTIPGHPSSSWRVNCPDGQSYVFVYRIETNYPNQLFTVWTVGDVDTELQLYTEHGGIDPSGGRGSDRSSDNDNDLFSVVAPRTVFYIALWSYFDPGFASPGSGTFRICARTAGDRTCDPPTEHTPPPPPIERLRTPQELMVSSITRQGNEYVVTFSWEPVEGATFYLVNGSSGDNVYRTPDWPNSTRIYNTHYTTPVQPGVIYTLGVWAGNEAGTSEAADWQGVPRQEEEVERGERVATLMNLSPWQAWVHLYCRNERLAPDTEQENPCRVTFECNGVEGEPVTWTVDVEPKTIFSYWQNKTADDGSSANLQAALMDAGKTEQEARRRTTCEVFSDGDLAVRGYTLFGGQPTLVPVAIY